MDGQRISSTAFSSDGSEVISRKIEASAILQSDLNRGAERDVHGYYELERCLTFVRAHDFQRVGTQHHPSSIYDDMHDG